VARWDDVVEAVRASRRGMVASALAEATPKSVADGVVTVQVAGDVLVEALNNGAETILAALRAHFSGVTRLVARLPEAAAVVATKRMTAEDVIANRVATLRKDAPLLDAAFDMLDLRLID
jgi:hypothetical protein